ncbi:putative gelsolin homology domain containing protein [Lyophyllum shimeji]|uniref:Gelsolin homology domain containing protein n=1 Tax=Lyophyllum shimeji TaxID=47721 RepID=A0A9P3PLN5_LYOSH|nr:putative gelsolin homology domain containing protein [Lyophyllum shimeji]
MAHLTKLKTYDIQNSNIALLGSDLEKHVREHAGDSESAWNEAGSKPGLRIWRIESFNVVEWPDERIGSFYDGDSYIILHTYKKTPDSDALWYDLHFWLGAETTQDEAATAAYKTAELDDHLHGLPVQYREVQGYESPRFLSYFPKFLCLKGGVATGFHHVTAVPPLDLQRLYRVHLSHGSGANNLLVREVSPEASSLVSGDVYVLDKGTQLWQFNTKASSGKEKFTAAEFVQGLANERGGQCDVIVYDEGSPGAGIFLSEFGEGVTLRDADAPEYLNVQPALIRISDARGAAAFELVGPPSRASLNSSDAFLLDNSSDPLGPAVYVWLGNGASLNERRLAVQYAQDYLNRKMVQLSDRRVEVAIPVVKMNEGNESEDFFQALDA